MTIVSYWRISSSILFLRKALKSRSDEKAQGRFEEDTGGINPWFLDFPTVLQAPYSSLWGTLSSIEKNAANSIVESGSKSFFSAWTSHRSHFRYLTNMPLIYFLFDRVQCQLATQFLDQWEPQQRPGEVLMIASWLFPQQLNEHFSPEGIWIASDPLSLPVSASLKLLDQERVGATCRAKPGHELQEGCIAPLALTLASGVQSNSGPFNLWIEAILAYPTGQLINLRPKESWQEWVLRVKNRLEVEAS